MIAHPETTLENEIKMLRGHILETAGNRTHKMYSQYLTGDVYFYSAEECSISPLITELKGCPKKKQLNKASLMVTRSSFRSAGFAHQSATRNTTSICRNT